MLGPCLVVVLAFAALAPPLAAAGPIQTLSGDPNSTEPDVAVDEGGTAHVAWLQHPEGSSTRVVYCQVPRGATACSRTQSFDLGDSAPRVNLMANGEIVITSERLFQARMYAVRSADGGQSFGAPQLIGDLSGTSLGTEELGWGGEVEAGPGNFSLSMIGRGGDRSCFESDSSLRFSVAPIDGEATTAAELAECSKATYGSSLAFVDPTTPIVAYADTGYQLRYRRWGGSGDYNSQETWNPEATAPFSAAFPRLADGPRGTYLLYSDGSRQTFSVRRYEPQSNSFLAPQRIDEMSAVGPLLASREFFEDGGGNLHAIYVSALGSRREELRQAVSPPGEGLHKPETLAAFDDGRTSLVNLRADAASDGGGLAVADGTGAVGVYMVALRPTVAAKCPGVLRVGVAVIRAARGCFKKHGGKLVASGPVTVNGVELEPRAGAKGFKVEIDRRSRTLRTTAPAAVHTGQVMLDRGVIAWQLPKGPGTVRSLGSADKTTFNQLGRFARKLFEFPVEGDADLLLAKGERASIPTHFGLPGILGGVSGDVTLHTDSSGLNLDKLRITAPQAAMGLLHIAGIKVTYDGQNRFVGSASLELPPAYSAFTVGFGFLDGRLNYIHYDQPFTPTLPIVAAPYLGVPPQPLIGLEDLAIDYVDQPGSRSLTGSVGIEGGGSYAGLRTARLDGSVGLEFPASGPAAITAKGNLSVVSIPFASGGVRFSTDGLLTFDGSFAFPPPGRWSGIGGVEGSVDGWASVAAPVAFSASGGAEVHVGPLSGGGEAVLSSKGISACAHLPQPPPPADVIPDIGITYRWGDGYPTPSCNVGSFKLAKPAGAGASAAGATSAVSIPRGLPRAVIEVDGADAAPQVRVVAPDGSSISSGPEATAAGRFLAEELGEAHRTYVSIGEPPAGTYTVEELPGSAAVTRTRIAEGLPPPRVKVRVVGKGRKRGLRYSVRKIRGQRVTFAEQSRSGLYQVLGSTAKRRGHISFRPRLTTGRKRRIVALVEENGLPRARLLLARFKAPKRHLAAKPRGLRIRRRGGKLLVAWRGVRGAEGYRVRVALPRDGRNLLRFLGPELRRLRLRRVEADDSARVLVQAIGQDARPGKPARAKLKPRHRPKRSRGRR